MLGMTRFKGIDMIRPARAWLALAAAIGLALAALFWGALAWPTSVAGQDNVRTPAVAGQFYPADADELRIMVDALLANAAHSEGEPIGLMAPHAGYIFSGAVAARAFKQIEGVQYDVIVVIGPNHRDPAFDKVSVYAEGAFRTPLGEVPVDTETARKLLEADERLVFDRKVHSAEHSIEVELPFLQRLYPSGFSFVPIVIGRHTAQNIDALSNALIGVLSGHKALIVASSDMSHYPPYEQANQIDRRTLAAIETLDPEEVRWCEVRALAEDIPNLGTTLCGGDAVEVVMRVSQALGANQATTLMYANSGDTPFGDRDNVVGYGAVMFWRSDAPQTPTATAGEKAIALSPTPRGKLSQEHKDWLLNLARSTLENYLKAGVVPLAQPQEPELQRPAGVFVTLKEYGELRGCIGRIVGDLPLYLAVQKMTLAAALQDSRFPPVSVAELPALEYEISVLSPTEPVDSVEDIEVGKHGVILVKDGHQAVFLPQVAVEQGWTRDQMLAHLSEKAGLPADAWREGAQFYVFTADVF